MTPDRFDLEGPPREPDKPPAERPDYRVYRSRRGLLSRLRDRGERPSLGRRGGGGGGKPPRHNLLRRREPGAPRPARPVTWQRVAKWVGIWAAAWVLVSLVLFMISAQISKSRLDAPAKAALTNSGSLLTSPNTVLVIGSDKRTGEQGRGRSDTLLLMRFDGGKAAKLSIPRDTGVAIPGFGFQKVNAAYALGGAALTIKTLEQNFPPLKINHVMLVNFDGFADFIDAMGGVKVKLENCVKSTFEGRTVRYPKGDVHLGGQEALDIARIRKNACNPSENDLTRAGRQQKIINSVQDQLRSPLRFPINFIRLPWMSWAAPGAIDSDMGGWTLLQLYMEMQRTGTESPQVLKPTGASGTVLVVSPQAKQEAINRFLAAQ